MLSVWCFPRCLLLSVGEVLKLSSSIDNQSSPFFEFGEYQDGNNTPYSDYKIISGTVIYTIAMIIV